MDSPVTTRLAALAAAWLLTLAVATPAAAAMPPPAPILCATAEITGFSLGRDEQGHPALAMSGWIQPCGPVAADDGFIAIRYYPLTGPEYRISHPYTAGSAPTAFDVQVDLWRNDSDSGFPPAVCIASAPRQPVACLAIELSPDDQGAPVIRPIPTDDDRLQPFTRPVQRPTCGTCL